MTTYTEFLTKKQIVAPSVGVDVDRDHLHSEAFGFQRDLTLWSLRKGRAALFASTGLGKTLMQLDWARHAGDRVLILAPLGVTRQTVTEGLRWKIPVRYARGQNEVRPEGITITNYEMADHFDPYRFDAVVLDESSKPSYYRIAVKNLTRAADVARSGDLFSWASVVVGEA